MEILVPLAPFAMAVFIVAIVFYFNSKNRAAVLETVREASRNGQQLDAETIKALGMPQKDNRNGDLKAGAILVAIAAAFLVLGFSIGHIDDGGAQEAVPVMASIAAFPGFIGLVLLGFGLVKKRDDKA
jgi:membrane associated rhomboid family serine protease